jgi:hypothetical protein
MREAEAKRQDGFEIDRGTSRARIDEASGLGDTDTHDSAIRLAESPTPPMTSTGLSAYSWT